MQRSSHGTCVRELFAILMLLCVVVVEAIARSRRSRIGGSARITRQSSIACAKSSRMPQQPASAEVGRSGRLLAAALAVMSPVSRRPRTAMHAPPPDTWKRPRNRGRRQPGQHKTAGSPRGPGFRGPGEIRPRGVRATRTWRGRIPLTESGPCTLLGTLGMWPDSVGLPSGPVRMGPHGPMDAAVGGP